jgi:hypothetical protein
MIMKTVLLILVIAIAGSLQAQSLKDALYSGKLKSDTGSVVKKGDSLKLRENIPPAKKDSLKIETALGDSGKKNLSDSTASTIQATTSPVVPAVSPAADNNRVWKQFVDEYTVIIKSEVMPSKKIKQGTYSILIEYEIGLDGSVSTTNVSCSPQSSYLEEQIKVRMMINAPQLMPVLMSNGKPRKVLKKQLLTFSKEKE